MNIAEASQRFGIARRTLQQACSRGDVPGARLRSNGWEAPESSFARFAAARPRPGRRPGKAPRAGELSLPEGWASDLFWDMPDRRMVPRRTAIERVLNFGRDDEVRWLLQQVSEAEIRSVLRTSRRLTPKAARFWAILLGVPDREVAALAAPFLRS